MTVELFPSGLLSGRSVSLAQSDETQLTSRIPNTQAACDKRRQFFRDPDQSSRHLASKCIPIKTIAVEKIAIALKTPVQGLPGQ